VWRVHDGCMKKPLVVVVPKAPGQITEAHADVEIVYSGHRPQSTRRAFVDGGTAQV
jgi:hypothetical protein